MPGTESLRQHSCPVHIQIENLNPEFRSALLKLPSSRPSSRKSLSNLPSRNHHRFWQSCVQHSMNCLASSLLVNCRTYSPLSFLSGWYPDRNTYGGGRRAARLIRAPPSQFAQSTSPLVTYYKQKGERISRCLRQ
jgi:hypothetical protein